MLAETKKKSSSWETTVKRFVDIGTDGEPVGAVVLTTGATEGQFFDDLPFFRFLWPPTQIEGNANKLIAMKRRVSLVMNIIAGVRINN